MVRIFNIYFNFGGQSHNAIVSVRTTPFFTEYSLNNIREDLTELLPGNKILSNGKDHFVFQHVAPHHSQALMNAIIKAVSEHVHATEV